MTAGVVVAACGSAPGATTAAATSSNVATVGSGANCIPDLNTTHVSLVALQRAEAAGEISSGSSAQQVREGAVPAPPLARLLAQGRMSQTPRAGSAVSSAFGGPQVFLYQTSCDPSDVRAYYVAVLGENQWTGEFV
ncbi:MAG TPA: hypothetical protein VGP33_16190, partial [Chloroflexota bacterium]|nr:hypothetical protein [Chloroflexota bacterium]